MSLELFRSTIEDKVERLKLSHNNDAHAAFLRLIFYLVTGRGYDELEPEDIIDGTGEYQIDALHIDTSSQEQVVVTLIQVTYSDTLSFNRIVKMHAGLDYLLRQPKAAYSTLKNSALKDKIQVFRDLRSEVLPANIKLQCYYATLGDTSKPSEEFTEQVKRIRSEYGNDVGDFNYEPVGPAEIFGLLNIREKRSAKANDRLKIIYDQNKANLLEHAIENVSGVICTVEAQEIARVVNEHVTVFDENLRRFLGTTGAVNKAIRQSCSSETDAPLFWFLNNGITIVCDKLSVHKDIDNPFVDIKNIRIVNGCQTASTLTKAKVSNLLQPSTRVLVRVFETNSPALAEKLVITTNTQNKITSRDLHAQDEIQAHIQAEFDRRFNIKYERTPNEFADLAEAEIVSNDKIGQAYMGVVKKRMGDANRRQGKLWGVYYEQVFNSSVYPETYLLVYRIVEACTKRKRQLLQSLSDADLRRTVVSNGTYHLARITTFNWRNGDDWNDLEQIRRELQKLKDEPELLNKYYEDALSELVEMFNSDEQFGQDPSVALKSSRLEDEIERNLYLRFAHKHKSAKKKRGQPKS